jgi:hypothetical protein
MAVLRDDDAAVGRGGWFVRRAALKIGGAALLVAIAVLLSSYLIGSRPRTYSVGDEALLEIYTLEAVHGRLQVGAYSRFGWNHPGPAWFYAFAPGYVASGYREESLFATTLVLNLASVVALLWLLRRSGGPVALSAAVFWIGWYYFRRGEPVGWDFGDLLASSWNPHAPILPLMLLIGLSAAVMAGWVALLPAVVGLASLVAQAHIGLVPVSFGLAGIACVVGVAMRLAPKGPAPMTHGPVRRVARVIDAVALAYGLLLLWIFVVGGFDAHIGALSITVNSWRHLAQVLVILVCLRHVVDRRHPVVASLWAGRPNWFGIRAPVQDRRTIWRALAWSGVVGLLFWILPLVQEFTASGQGNLSRILEFMGGSNTRNLASGIAAFTMYLIGPLRSGFSVAAGGRIVTGADLSWPVCAAAAIELCLLTAILAWALEKRRDFPAALCLASLVASLTALLSLLHVQGDLYDHIAFWVSAVGTMNLVAISVGLWTWMSERWHIRVAVPAVWSHWLAAAFVTGLAVFGTVHFLEGHQQSRFSDEVADVRTLADDVQVQIAKRGLAGQPLRIDVTQPAWAIAAGVILELYKAGVPVSVTGDVGFVYGPALAPTGREVAELLIAEQPSQKLLEGPPAFEFVAESRDVSIYVRTLRRIDSLGIAGTALKGDNDRFAALSGSRRHRFLLLASDFKLLASNF